MIVDLAVRRRLFAEEIEAVCGVKTPGLVEAFAAVAREAFLGPGPWLVKTIDGDTNSAPRPTEDSDPRHVYHNIPIAIDPARQLFNGQPTTIAAWIDALGVTPGMRALHVGAGLGYYTAVIAHCVGSSGLVVACEVDAALGAAARRNLQGSTNVDVRIDDASRVEGPFDAILVNAGTTHAHEEWLRSLAVGGRLLVPLTVPIAPTLGKGFVFVVTKTGDRQFAARALSMPVAIYSASGVRDESLSPALGHAMKKGWPVVTRLRLDVHEPAASCWYHTDRFCFDAA